MLWVLANGPVPAGTGFLGPFFSCSFAGQNCSNKKKPKIPMATSPTRGMSRRNTPVVSGTDTSMGMSGLNPAMAKMTDGSLKLERLGSSSGARNWHAFVPNCKLLASGKWLKPERASVCPPRPTFTDFDVALVPSAFICSGELASMLKNMGSDVWGTRTTTEAFSSQSKKYFVLASALGTTFLLEMALRKKSRVVSSVSEASSHVCPTTCPWTANAMHEMWINRRLMHIAHN
mmetsp:Transcript_34265/g.91509  ORF Transcript_34265/g.91509 Transcript_34265/m.91509 type:complete len:232 (-) Transcript_34265:34-729(-)